MPRSILDEAFATANIEAGIVMTALDADVIKAYVELELGVAIIASMAFSPDRDPGLRLLDARKLIALNTARIAVRRRSYMRSYMHKFLEPSARS